jgi:NADP-dependent 3-hydroxy acid dehydrogenase YdfG
MQNFNQKIIVITGAGSGIGRALAVSFAQAGALLALNDYNETSLHETQVLVEKHTKTPAFCSVFDVANAEKMFAFANAVVAHFGVVDIVINNAGVSMGSAIFDEADLADIERVFDTNFKGVLYGCKAFIPYLLQRPEAHLLNVASIFGLTGIAYAEAYAASKFAVNGLTLSLMQTYRNTNLTVQGVYPGGIKTNIVANSINKASQNDNDFETKFLKRSPESAAAHIIRGIQQRKSRILIGSEANILDMTVRIAPIIGCEIVNERIQRKVR